MPTDLERLKMNEKARVRKITIGEVDNLGALRTLLETFTDECKLMIVVKVSYVHDGREGFIDLEGY